MSPFDAKIGSQCTRNSKAKAMLFRQSGRQSVGFLLSLILSLCLMFVDFHYQSLNIVRSGFAFLVSPLQYAVDYPVRLFDWVHSLMQAKKKLVDDNIRLHYQ